MADWVTIKLSDLPPPESYKMRPHRPGKVKFMPWQVCQGCGLVYLRNQLTAWALSKGCDYDIHPDYQRASRQLGKYSNG